MPTLIIAAITHIEVSIYTNYRTIVVHAVEKKHQVDHISLRYELILTARAQRNEKKTNRAFSENNSRCEDYRLEFNTFYQCMNSI